MKSMFKCIFILFIFISSQCYSQEDAFTVVDTQPEFPGGLDAFYGYVNKHLLYPVIARNSRTEGKVFVEFIVETTGEITEVKTIKGLSDRCDHEAERLLKNAPDFIPGHKKGKPVRVKLILPITFSLNEEGENKSTKQDTEEYLPPARSVGEAITNQELNQLYLNFNGLTELDKNIVEATQLVHLDLSGNKLEELPDEIGALINLQELYLTGNLLSELPATFSKLESLRKIYLDRNEVYKFPVQLLELWNLEMIDISYTNINELPQQIAEMPNLKIIYARGTRISSNQIKSIRDKNPSIEILK